MEQGNRYVCVWGLRYTHAAHFILKLDVVYCCDPVFLNGDIVLAFEKQECSSLSSRMKLNMYLFKSLYIYIYSILLHFYSLLSDNSVTNTQPYLQITYLTNNCMCCISWLNSAYIPYVNGILMTLKCELHRVYNLNSRQKWKIKI